MTALLATAEWGGPFEVPPVGELFNFPAFGPLQISRVIILMLFATALAALLFVVAGARAKVVPGKLQMVAETIIEFIREQIALQVIGKDGLRFVPLLLAIFMFVWFNNLLEITPFVNFPTTSHMAFPALLAGMVWLYYLFLGFKTHGAGYLKNIALPPNVPVPVLVLLAPLELLTVLVLRPFTLAVRLFANMVAGHILLTIVFLACHAFFYLKFPGIIVGLFTVVVSPLAVGFELFIASLQAYIFVILTAVYIGDALHAEH